LIFDDYMTDYDGEFGALHLGMGKIPGINL
jgi:hypothetical protein